MDADLVMFVEFLQRNRIRATYQAVAEAAGVPTRSMGLRLGPRTQLASWVVNAKTGKPTGYSDSEIHPELLINAEIIELGQDLIRRMQREKR